MMLCKSPSFDYGKWSEQMERTGKANAGNEDFLSSSRQCVSRIKLRSGSHE